MTKNEIAVKSEFFINAVFIEDMISKYIADKMGIKSTVDSEILGNSKNAMTFDQKMDFVMESGNLSIIDKSKISVYKAIKKEFLLNQDASSLEESFTSLDHNDDFLLIMYPQEPFLPRNEKLTVACYNLIEDVSQLVSGYTDKHQIKIQKDNKLKSIFRIKNKAVGLSRMAMLFSFLFIR
jgi:hypothetical protein